MCQKIAYLQKHPISSHWSSFRIEWLSEAPKTEHKYEGLLAEIQIEEDFRSELVLFFFFQIMPLNQFVADYQLNASKKIVFTYLSTASGLQEWFADTVRIDWKKNYIFNFDHEDHFAKPTVIKANLHIRWDFFDPNGSDDEKESFIEFKLDETELTNSLFLRVIDHSDFYELDELEAIWEGLILRLKQIIGG